MVTVLLLLLYTYLQETNFRSDYMYVYRHVYTTRGVALCQAMVRRTNSDAVSVVQVNNLTSAGIYVICNIVLWGYVCV